jgi:hypothetical protein
MAMSTGDRSIRVSRPQAEAKRTHDAVKRGAALAARAQANTAPQRVAELLAD